MRQARASLLAARGRRAVQRKDWSSAAAYYQAAVDRDPTHARWHEQLGYAHQKARNWTAATHAYQAAVSRDPDRPMAYYRLGVALLKTDNWQAAANALRQADRRAAGLVPKRRPTERLPLEQRIDLSLLGKPAYAYGLHRGSTLAEKLGIPRISAAELGVAGGNGLVALERHAQTVEAMTDVKVDVLGFDTGEGLYEPADHRDMPYRFAAGNYRIDVPKLEARLKRAELVLGDAGVTFAEFLGSGPEPIGFLSFDMDLYTSTSAVLRHLGDDADERWFLPRVTVYFDDVVGNRGQEYNEHTGELLAIAEFNQANDTVKLAEDRRFRTVPISFPWHHGVYTMHRFGHPDYTTYVSRSSPNSLRLRG